MSDSISTMNDRQLRNEVQLLRDELAIMKRKYEDIIYNLDTDNFSSRFVKEQGKMKTAIEVNAKGITTKVSDADFQSSKAQTAQKIEMEVKKLTAADSELSSKITQEADKIRSEVKETTDAINGEFEKYSTIEQTAENISATVTKEYVTNLIDGDYVTNDALETYKVTVTSAIDQKADEINLSVSSTYETQDNANGQYSSLRNSISSISIEAGEISSRVGDVESGKFGEYTLFQQTDDTFLFDGNYMRISSAIILTDNYGNSAFSLFHQQSDNTVYMWGAGNYQYSPVVIGNKNASGTAQGVYLYDDIDANHIATRGWVLDNAGGGGTVVAVFG